MIDQLPQPTAFVSTTFELVSASKSWLEYFDFLPLEKKGKTIFDFFNPTEHHFWESCLKKCFNGETELQTKSILPDSQSERWFESFNVPWYDDGKNIIGAIIQIRDITQRLEHKFEYEKLQSVLEEQSEVAKVGTWEYNVFTDTLYWSRMTKKIYGVDVNYAPNIDETINYFTQGHHRNTFAMLWHKGVNRGESWSKKLKLTTYDAQEKWVIATGKPLYKNGVITHLTGTFQDVTERVEQQIKTKENEQLLRTLVDSLPLNVYIKDHESKKIFANRAECDYLGIKRIEDVVGVSDESFFDEKSVKTSRDEDLQVIKNKMPIIGKRTHLVKKDGTDTEFLTHKIPLLNFEGECKRIVGTSMDLTEIIQKENQLSDLLRLTSIQNKKLINFAHVISHNLRSHSANLSMLLDFLVEETKENEKEKILKMLIEASNNLMETLGDLNEVVDINSNKHIEKESLNLCNEINKVSQNLSELIKRNHAKIKNDVSDGIYIKAIPAYLENILQNLLTNSIKYKHPERIPIISLNAQQKDEEIILSITDNGLGIDMEKHGEKLFNMYKTFHSHSDGKGFGLHLTKNQIEAMGGSITATSEVNKGSTFNICFKNE